MAGKKLQAHHRAWLSAHPDRTEEWLRDMFREGFDVHHVDGDHSNDTPLNLVLIEAVDHMRLHGFKLKDGLKGFRARVRDQAVERRKAKSGPKPRHREPITGAPPAANAPRLIFTNDGDVKAYISRAGNC